jgi:ankyrin repeat protein
MPILQIQDILAQLTKSEARRALRNLSKNLTEVFRSTIERILNLPADPRHSMNRQSLAKKTLMWISHAKRVLTVTELQHALAIRTEDSQESDLDRENFVDPQLIVDSCFGLVEIDEKSSNIRFVHFSLQEYLRSHDHGLFANGDLELTKVCLRYMSLDSVKDLHLKNRNSFLSALEDLAFLNYATQEWGYHARSIPVDGYIDLALKFLRSISHLQTAARVRDHNSPYFRKFRERMFSWALSGGAGISICASFGLTGLMEVMIDENKQPVLDARNMYGSTPLHEAAMKGYIDTAQLLVQHGANVLDVNLGKSTPLYLAVATGQIAMARLLLQTRSRAQLDAPGKEGWTVLHKAADLGNEEIVTLLVQQGAMVNAVDERKTNPLHLAARKGHLEVVRVLILSGAEVNTTAIDRLIALDYAITSGQLEVTKMLLDNGALIERRGGDRWTPLHRAARGGHAQIVALLLQKGTDMLSEDLKGETPLHAAARSGKREVVELLLSARPDLNGEKLFKKDKKGSTPRDVAFFTAHFDIHKQLRAAEIEAMPSTPSTTDKIASAIESGKRDKIRRLLAEKPGDVDARIEGRQPGLHLAMQEQQIDIVKVFLDNGADINSIGYHGWTPLHIAASVGNLALTELCLARGASVHAVTDTKQTPLHKACSSKNVQVVRTLLDAGASREAVTERGMRPLHIAAHQNNIDMVRLLLQEHNVDILALDKYGDTAANWAQRSGHLDLLHYLKSEEKRRKKMQEAVLI